MRWKSILYNGTANLVMGLQTTSSCMNIPFKTCCITTHNIYSRTLIIRTPVCQWNHKSVHLFRIPLIYKCSSIELIKYRPVALLTKHTLIEQSPLLFSCQIIEVWISKSCCIFISTTIHAAMYWKVNHCHFYQNHEKHYLETLPERIGNLRLSIYACLLCIRNGKNLFWLTMWLV